MCAAYSVSRITRLWPLALFFIFMNIASINARVILNFNINGELPQRRKVFQKNLAMGLMRNHLESKAQIKSLPTDLYYFLAKYRRLLGEEDVTEQPARKRGTCWLCGRKKNSSTTMKRSLCNALCAKNKQKNRFFAYNVNKKKWV